MSEAWSVNPVRSYYVAAAVLVACVRTVMRLARVENQATACAMRRGLRFPDWVSFRADGARKDTQ